MSAAVHYYLSAWASKQSNASLRTDIAPGSDGAREADAHAAVLAATIVDCDLLPLTDLRPNTSRLRTSWLDGNRWIQHAVCLEGDGPFCKTTHAQAIEHLKLRLPPRNDWSTVTCPSCVGKIPAYSISASGHCATCAKGWRPLHYAHELKPCMLCHEPWCPLHRKHFSECDCLGPETADPATIQEPTEPGATRWARPREEQTT